MLDENKQMIYMRKLFLLLLLLLSTALYAQKKDGTLTEDDMKNVEKDVQKVTDDAIKEIETIAANKEKAIMAI